jgi:hypothetical protein
METPSTRARFTLEDVEVVAVLVTTPMARVFMSEKVAEMSAVFGSTVRESEFTTKFISIERFFRFLMFELARKVSKESNFIALAISPINLEKTLMAAPYS